MKTPMEKVRQAQARQEWVYNGHNVNMKTIKPFFLGAFTSSANEYQLSAAVSLVATAAANVRQCSEAVHGSAAAAAAATTASSSTRYGPAAAADSIHYLPAGSSAAAAGSSGSAASCQYPTASTKRLTTTTTETHTPTTSSAPGTTLHQCIVSS